MPHSFRMGSQVPGGGPKGGRKAVVPGLTARAGYNFCLPHLSLRLPLPEPLPTRGAGSPKRWQARTPAMAAGLTDHIWTMQEVLLFRVPPWRQEVAG